VRHVVAGSPAAKAGVKPGDRVLAIDGVAVDGEDVLGAQQRLSGAAGTHVKVRMESKTLDLERITLI